MKLEQWVLFIDMLGYQDINGAISDDKKANDFISFMKENENLFSNQDSQENQNMYKNSTFDLYAFYDIQRAFVSDSLIINFKPKEIEDKSINETKRVYHSANTLIIILNRLQSFIFNCAKSKNILLRGGVSNKYCHIHNNFAVGKGLIDAYNYESKFANYPRIALSKNISDNVQLIESMNTIVKFIYNKDTFLKVDNDNIYYLDFIKFNIALSEKANTVFPLGKKSLDIVLTGYKNCLENKLSEMMERLCNATTEEDKKRVIKVKSKIDWAVSYYNESVKELNPQYHIK